MKKMIHNYDDLFVDLTVNEESKTFYKSGETNSEFVNISFDKDEVNNRTIQKGMLTQMNKLKYFTEYSLIIFAWFVSFLILFYNDDLSQYFILVSNGEIKYMNVFILFVCSLLLLPTILHIYFFINIPKPIKNHIKFY